MNGRSLALAPHGQLPAAHHKLLIRELEGLAAGRWDRLMLLLPPGSAKSTYASLLFPPWFMANRPWAQVIAASHTAGLARSFGRGVRALIQEHESRLGLTLDANNRSAGRFGVVGGGSYFATGVRGPITGRRADLVLIDDPVKSQAEADSGLARDHVWDWFRSDLITRLKPGGRVVLVMTRWHPDDLGGRLLSASDAWRVVRLPALAEAGDALGRARGRAAVAGVGRRGGVAAQATGAGGPDVRGAVPAIAALAGRAAVQDGQPSDRRRAGDRGERARMGPRGQRRRGLDGRCCG